MTKIKEMQNLISSIAENTKVEENTEVKNVEDTKEKEEFRRYLEQTIYERCLEVGSKMKNAKTDEEINAADDEYINLENNCCVFMTREEFGIIRDKAYDKLYENEINKLMSINKEDITVDTVKDFININTNLYWKIINENDLGIFGLCEKGLKCNNAYYMKARGLKHRVERQPLEENKQMYFDLKKDYETLAELEKKYKVRNSKKQPYIAPPAELFTDDSELKSNQLYTCKLDLGDADEDISDWEESDKEYFELDKRHYEGLIEELENKYGDKLDHIEGYRYSVSNLNEDDIELLESLIQDTESNLDYCYVRYDFEEVEAA